MKKNKLSINIIGKVPLPIGGVTIHTFRLYQWLKKENDIDVKLTALNKHSIEDKNIPYTNLILWIIKRLIFGVQENIIHYQGSNYIGLVILSFIKKIHPSFTLVWSIHSEYLVSKIKKKYLISMVFKEIDYIIADNIYIEKQLIAENFNKDKIKIISPFLMPENYSHEYIDLFLEYRKSNLKILFFYAYKLSFNSNGKDVYGLDTLIEAFKKINENVILILLIPAMNDEEKKYYDRIIGQLDNKYKKRVVLKNYTNIEGWQYIQSSDIFIRPTITDGDALSVREALYMDKHTVVSDCTVRPDGVTLFKTSDHLDLAKKVNELLNVKKEQDHKKEKNNINSFICFYKKIQKI